jgi:hypothetical protein
VKPEESGEGSSGREMPRKGKLSRRAAIVDGGLTKVGLFKDRNCKDFFVEALKETVEFISKRFNPKGT